MEKDGKDFQEGYSGKGAWNSRKGKESIGYHQAKPKQREIGWDR